MTTRCPHANLVVRTCICDPMNEEQAECPGHVTAILYGGHFVWIAHGPAYALQVRRVRATRCSFVI